MSNLDIKEGAPAEGYEYGSIHQGKDGRRYIVLANGNWFDISKPRWVNPSKQIADLQRDIREVSRRQHEKS